MDSINILIWNVGGLNDRNRRDNLRKVVEVSRPSVFYLQETKLSHISERVVSSCLGIEFTQFVYLPAQQTRGGILIAWRDCSFSVDHYCVHCYSVSVLLSSKDDPAWWLIGVYGPQHEVDKVAFLEELREVCDNCPAPWMLAGDFNMIFCSEDRTMILSTVP